MKALIEFGHRFAFGLAAALAMSLHSMPVAKTSAFQAPRWDRGPQLLDDVTYQEAITCGAESPYWRSCAEENLSLSCNTSDVSVSLVTPFVRVMTDVDRATKQLRKPSPPALTMINKAQPTVLVSPGDNITTFRSPARMVIERDGKRVTPSSARLTPISLSNALGVRRAATRGEFSFPMELFNLPPQSADVGEGSTVLTILIALDSGQPARCDLWLQKLKRLR